MNVSLSDVVRTGRDGRVSKLPNVYLRGGGHTVCGTPGALEERSRVS